jgi:hypothetical protein
MKSAILVLAFLVFAFSAKSQAPSEVNILSFKTDKGKVVQLNEDTASNSLVFRYGTLGNWEIVFIDNLDDDEAIFSSSGYFRGGGIDNAGLDLNYLHFNYDGYDYSVFDEWSAEGETHAHGVRIEATAGSTTPDVADLSADEASVVGGFSYRDYEGLIEE